MEISKLKPYTIVALMALGVSLSACKKEESSISESVKDGLDLRENEPIKDAGEDLKDAAKDTGEAVKDKAEEVKDDVKN